jgi:hypothetical protein
MPESNRPRATSCPQVGLSIRYFSGWAAGGGTGIPIIANIAWQWMVQRGEVLWLSAWPEITPAGPDDAGTLGGRPVARYRRGQTSCEVDRAQMAGNQSAGRKPGRRLNKISVQFFERAPSHRPPSLPSPVVAAAVLTETPMKRGLRAFADAAGLLVGWLIAETALTRTRAKHVQERRHQNVSTKKWRRIGIQRHSLFVGT